MKSKLTINQKILLSGEAYKVIGIDSYILSNVVGGTQKWISYTLLTDKKKKTWISYGAIKNYFIQWAVISEKKFKKEATIPLNINLSGLANISFIGDPGYSKPFAELFWFNVQNRKYDFLLIERFIRHDANELKILDSYYQTGTILKDFRIES